MSPDMMDVIVVIKNVLSDIQEEEEKVGPASWSTISNDFKDATNIEYCFKINILFYLLLILFWFLLEYNTFLLYCQTISINFCYLYVPLIILTSHPLAFFPRN